MIQHMYSIRDQKAETFHVPFYAKTHGEAERSFKQVLNDEKSQIAQYPEDFDLYYIGKYDDQTGTVSPLDTPLHISKAVMLRRSADIPASTLS